MHYAKNNAKYALSISTIMNNLPNNKDPGIRNKKAINNLEEFLSSKMKKV